MKLFSKIQGEKKQNNSFHKNNVLSLTELLIIRGGNADIGDGIVKK
jgi:hypothetical protein